MPVTVINKSNFQKEVMQSEKTVLLDFWASWCGPCRALASVIDEISSEYAQIKVCKVNIDEEQELASQFEIMSIPTIVVIKNGNVTKKSVGFKPKSQILEML